MCPGMSRRICTCFPFVDLFVVGRSALSVDVGMRSSLGTRRACARSASASPRGGGASPPTLPGPSSSSRARRARTCAASCSSSMGCVFLSSVCLSIARPLFYASAVLRARDLCQSTASTRRCASASASARVHAARDRASFPSIANELTNTTYAGLDGPLSRPAAHYVHVHVRACVRV